jgi:hypothetical protein
MKKEGGVSGINRWALSSSTFPQIFYCFLKDLCPLNNKKTHFSGLTTQYTPRLNQGPSAAKKKHDTGWVLAWIFPFNFRGFLIIHLRSCCIQLLYNVQIMSQFNVY